MPMQFQWALTREWVGDEERKPKTALGMACWVQALQRERDVLGTVLDLFPVGVVLVDEEARVLWMNGTAQGLLQAADGLALVQGRLEGGCACQTLLLEEALQEGLDEARNGGRCRRRALALERPSGERPLDLVIVPFRAAAKAPPKTARAAILVWNEAAHARRLAGTAPGDLSG